MRDMFWIDGYYTSELTVAVVTCTRPVQDGTCHHFLMAQGGAHEVSPLLRVSWKLMAVGNGSSIISLWGYDQWLVVHNQGMAQIHM